MLRGNVKFRIQSEISAAISTLTAGVRRISLAIVAAHFLKGIVFLKLVWIWIVLTIRFASYGRFFERAKMSENCQKTSKTWFFWRFFRVRSNPLRESGCRVSKTRSFAILVSRVKKRLFQTSLKPV